MDSKQYLARRVCNLYVLIYDGNSRRLNRKWFYGEARNWTCYPWFIRHRFIPYTTAASQRDTPGYKATFLCCWNETLGIYAANLHWPKMKLYIVLKSIYFDDKLSFGVIFFSHRIPNALSMCLKKILDENHKLHNFYETFCSEGSKCKFLKTVKPVTQFVETRNYCVL